MGLHTVTLKLQLDDCAAARFLAGVSAERHENVAVAIEEAIAAILGVEPVKQLEIMEPTAAQDLEELEFSLSEALELEEIHQYLADYRPVTCSLIGEGIQSARLSSISEVLHRSLKL
jgi:hypothetical protein